MRRLLAAGAFALALATAPARAEVAVVINSGEDTVSVLSLKDYKEVGRFNVGREPHHLMLTPDGADLLIGNAMGNDLVALDPATGAMKRRVPKIDDPYQLGFTPDRKTLVVAGLRLDHVDFYEADGLKLAGRVKVGSMPSHLAFSPDNRFVYVTLQGSDELAGIDIAKREVVWKTKVGPTPAGVINTPKGLLVGIMNSDYVAVVDPATGAMTGKVVTGKGAHNLFPSKDKKRIYVTNRVANNIVALDAQTLKPVQTYNTLNGPDCLDFNADGTEMWVVARWARAVQVIDIATGQTKKKIPVGKSPHGIYVHGAPIPKTS